MKSTRLNLPEISVNFDEGLTQKNSDAKETLAETSGESPTSTLPHAHLSPTSRNRRDLFFKNMELEDDSLFLSFSIRTILARWEPNGLLSPFARLSSGGQITEDHAPPSSMLYNRLTAALRASAFCGEITASQKKRLPKQRSDVLNDINAKRTLIDTKRNEIIKKMKGLDEDLIKDIRRIQLLASMGRCNDYVSLIDHAEEKLAVTQAKMLDEFYEELDEIGNDLLAMSEKFSKWPDGGTVKENILEKFSDAINQIIINKAENTAIGRDSMLLGDIGATGAQKVDMAKIQQEPPEVVDKLERDYRKKLQAVIPESLPRSLKNYAMLLEALVMMEKFPEKLDKQVMKGWFYNLPTCLGNVKSTLQRSYRTIKVQGTDDLAQINFQSAHAQRQIISRANDSTFSRRSQPITVTPSVKTADAEPGSVTSSAKDSDSKSSDKISWSSDFIDEMDRINDISERCHFAVVRLVHVDFNEQGKIELNPGESIYESLMKNSNKLSEVADAWEDMQGNLEEIVNTLVPTGLDEKTKGHIKRLQSELAHQQFFAEAFSYAAKAYALNFVTAPAENKDRHEKSDTTLILSRADQGVQEVTGGTEPENASNFPLPDTKHDSKDDASLTLKPDSSVMAVDEPVTVPIANIRKEAIAARDQAKKLQVVATLNIDKFNSAQSSLIRSDLLEAAVKEFDNALKEYDRAIETLGDHYDLGSINLDELQKGRQHCYKRAELYRTYLHSPKGKAQSEETLQAIDTEGGLIIRKPLDGPSIIKLDHEGKVDHVVEAMVTFSPVVCKETGEQLKPPHSYFIHVHLADRVNVADPDVIENLRPEDIVAAHVKTKAYRFLGKTYERATGNIVPRGKFKNMEFAASLIKRAA